MTAVGDLLVGRTRGALSGGPDHAGIACYRGRESWRRVVIPSFWNTLRRWSTVPAVMNRRLLEASATARLSEDRETCISAGPW